jgi:hypothetical protein
MNTGSDELLGYFAEENLWLQQEVMRWKEVAENFIRKWQEVAENCITRRCTIYILRQGALG